MQVDTPWLDGKHTGTSDHPMTSLFVSAAAHIRNAQSILTLVPLLHYIISLWKGDRWIGYC